MGKVNALLATSAIYDSNISRKNDEKSSIIIILANQLLYYLK